MLTGGWSTTTPLYLSSNFGATWSSIPASAGVITSTYWYQVGVSSTGQYMIAASNTNTCLTYISSNYGVTWSALQIGSGLSTNVFVFNACCISGTGQYMFVQNIAGSFLSNDYGANWITITALPVTSTWRQPSMSYTGQYILTQVYQGQVWLSSGITGVGINNSTPQYALDTIGSLGINRGITPTYSSPVISAGQVGYIYTGTQTNTTTTAGTYTTLYTISNLPVGVYAVEGYVEQVTGSNNTRYVNINLNGTSLRSLLNYTGGGAAASGNGIDSVIVAFCTVTTANSTLTLNVYNNNAAVTATNAALNAIRLA